MLNERGFHYLRRRTLGNLQEGSCPYVLGFNTTCLLDQKIRQVLMGTIHRRHGQPAPTPRSPPDPAGDGLAPSQDCARHRAATRGRDGQGECLEGEKAGGDHVPHPGGGMLPEGAPDGSRRDGRATGAEAGGRWTRGSRIDALTMI